MDLQRDLTLGGAIARLKRHRLGIRHIFSIGAGSGGDSMFLQKNLCPDADMLLIEAQDTHLPALQKVSRSPNVDHVICAATKEDGVTHFLKSAPTGGAVTTTATAETVEVPTRAIDSLAAERGWNGPFFLKFDTHGVELDILAGAERTLEKTNLVMMEVYNFRLNFVRGENLVFHEMCQWMEQHGLRCVDMCEPLFRPNDGALWQMHLFFIRADHPVFRSNSYSAPPRL